jgi:hypothetical protein
VQNYIVHKLISKSIGRVKKVYLARPGVLNRSYPQLYTAKNQYRKLETNIPGKGIERPLSQFPYSCVCERFLHYHHRFAYSGAGNMWEYINRSQTLECGNWDWGRAIPRNGIHKWDFRCSVEYSSWLMDCLFTCVRMLIISNTVKERTVLCCVVLAQPALVGPASFSWPSQL